MNSVELVYYIVEKQPYKLGALHPEVHHYGRLSYEPLNICRDDGVTIAKINVMAESLKATLIFDIIEDFDAFDFEKIITFLVTHASNMVATDANREYIESISSLKISESSTENEDQLYEKALKIMFSEFIEGPCALTRALYYNQYIDGYYGGQDKKSDLSHPSLRKMYKDHEEFHHFDVHIGFNLILDNKYHILDKNLCDKMGYPNVECDYIELRGSYEARDDGVIPEEEIYEFGRKMFKNGKFVGNSNNNSNNDENKEEEEGELSIFRYCVFETWTKTKSGSEATSERRLKLIVDGPALDGTVEKLNTIAFSKDYNKFLEKNGLSDWSGYKDKEKLDEMRNLKKQIKALQKIIDQHGYNDDSE